MVHSKTKSLIFIFALLIFIFSHYNVAKAEAAESTWIVDERTGCKVWNPRPLPNESVTWSGKCKNGKAQGHGTLTWFKNGKQNGEPDVIYLIDGFVVGKIHDDFKGHIIGLPVEDYLVSLGDDEKTGVSFWAYSRRNPTNRCWSWTGGTRDVYGVLPNNKSRELLLDDETARSLIVKGGELLKEACGLKSTRIHVRLLPKNYKISKSHGYTNLSPVYADGEVRSKGYSYQNFVLESVRKKREMEERKEKEEKERKEALKLFNKFVNKNGVKAWPSMEELSANPFVYEGNVIAMTASFSTMQSATQGVFENSGKPFVVSNIPKGMFRVGGQVIVLAGKVLGKAELKVPVLGQMQVPLLKFVGVHFCKDRKCSSIIKKQYRKR